MCSASRSKRPRARGFTLIEALISLVLFVVVMVVALALLFTMRSFADRQAYYTAPRQAARRAIDYVGGFAESATDMNTNTAQNKYNPDALPTQIKLGGKNQTIPVNLAYDNLGGWDGASYHLEGATFAFGGGVSAERGDARRIRPPVAAGSGRAAPRRRDALAPVARAHGDHVRRSR